MVTATCDALSGRATLQGGTKGAILAHKSVRLDEVL